MAGRSKSLVPIEQIDGMIHTIRGVRVMLDRDLAEIYGVSTFRFNEAIKRNPESFRGSQSSVAQRRFYSSVQATRLLL